MDDDTLVAAFKAHTAGAAIVSRRIVINLADFADMKPMALVWRLERMGLMREGSWEWFKANGGITPEQVSEVRRARSTLEEK